jgi:ABC-type Fe3+ transport system permease subunit
MADFYADYKRLVVRLRQTVIQFWMKAKDTLIAAAAAAVVTLLVALLTYIFGVR